ncbi:hypothetical protein [Hymenobacter sediminis]|uniref:hypothetical protein n=1 Tax=Hymenobacter sediminis TaxID=2218621 RepID=UPI00139046DA|nr:hypothetical protein [Hymenobacter sediminis]
MHFVKSDYCLLGYSNFQFVNSGCIKINVSSRANGKPIREGVVFINNDIKNKAEVINGVVEINLEQGLYTLDISSSNSLGLKIKNLKVKNGKTTNVNAFLGSSLQI